jgi:hypothetical protein
MLVLIKNIIKIFAIQNNLIQQSDIDYIENLEFDARNYKKINGQKYIYLFNYQNIQRIEFGNIIINIDKDEDGDNEYYSIDKNLLFFINIADLLQADLLQEESLIEIIISTCKNNNF